MGMCTKCAGVCKLVTGGLILLNAFVWPKWDGIDGWFAWIGVLFVLFGALKLLVPNKCPGCAATCSTKKGKK